MKNKKRTAKEIEQELFQRYPKLAACGNEIRIAYQALLNMYQVGGKLLCAGNGGSAADSDHIVGELMKSFLFIRELDEQLERNLIANFLERGRDLAKELEGGLPAISLSSMTAINTAYSNDVAADGVFAQLVQTLGTSNDIFLGITTSGNSKNIIKALMVAKAKGLTTICLTGQLGGSCRDISDICICAPETETFKVQELHLPIYHALCAMLEAEIFNERK